MAAKSHSDLKLAASQKTTIPSVPFRTAMFDSTGNMTRTWVLFFEQLGAAFSAIMAGGVGPGAWGGVKVQTASYAAASADDGLLIVFNAAGAVNFSLPATAPANTWKVFVQNIGAAAVTLVPSGPELDGVVASATLAVGQGVYISTDGTNYFTQRGLVPAFGTNGTANGSQALLNLVAGTNVTITDDGSGDVTIASSGGTLTPPVTLSAAITQPILTLTQTGTGEALQVNASSSATEGIVVTGAPTDALLKLSGGTQVAIRIDNSANGAEGVNAVTDTVVALYGQSTSGFGVFGLSTSAVGVLAESTSAAGIQATSTSGPGGNFASGTGTGITASASGTAPAVMAQAFGSNAGIQIAQQLFANLAAVANGSMQYCSDAKNIHDDGAAAGSVATGGGHGSMLAYVNGSWRVMC